MSENSRGISRLTNSSYKAKNEFSLFWSYSRSLIWWIKILGVALVWTIVFEQIIQY